MLRECQDLECCTFNFSIRLNSSFSIRTVRKMRWSICCTNIIECVFMDQVHCLGVILDCQSKSNKNDFILADVKRTAALISCLVNGLQFPR